MSFRILLYTIIISLLTIVRHRLLPFFRCSVGIGVSRWLVLEPTRDQSSKKFLCNHSGIHEVVRDEDHRNSNPDQRETHCGFAGQQSVDPEISNRDSKNEAAKEAEEIKDAESHRW